MKILLALSIFIGGAISLVVEIVGTRLISPVFGGTVFVWASIITVTLGGLALGYYLGAKASRSARHGSILALSFLANGVVAAVLPMLAKPIADFSYAAGMQYGPLLAGTILFLPFFLLSGLAMPIAVKINSELQLPGVIAGKLYSVSTAGSLFGAIIAGFFLLPNFSVDKIFIFSGIILIFLGSLLAGLGSKIGHLSLLLLLAPLATSATYSAKQKPWVRILAEKNTFYSSIKVIEFQGLRCMLFGLIPQSCEPAPGSVAYAQVYDSSPEIAPLLKTAGGNENILMIGGGGGTILSGIDPTNKITVIELDPTVMEYARQYFSANDLPIKETIIDDARHAVRGLSAAGKKYNLVILDAFLSNTPAPELLTQESFANLKEIMDADGALVINAGVFRAAPTADNKLLASIYSTAKTSFPNVVAFWDGEESHNLIFYAGLRKKISPRSGEINPTDGQILTDNFNPLEYLDLDRNLELTASFSKLFSRGI